MLLKILSTIIFLILFCYSNLCSQIKNVYEIKWDKEKYIVGSSMVTLVGALAIYQSRDPLTEEIINALDPNQVSSFDRSAIFRRNLDAPQLSNYFREGVFLFPFAALLGDQGKKEWQSLGIMYMETVMVNTALTSLSKSVFYRKRPFVYNPEVPLDEKLSKDASVSFYSGHVSHVASLSFFSASILNDLYPDSKIKWLWNSAAILFPGATAYLRYDSGRHFPTDLFVGYAVGAAVGYLIPKMHKVQSKDLTFTVLPSSDSVSLGARISF